MSNGTKYPLNATPLEFWGCLVPIVVGVVLLFVLAYLGA